MLKNTIINLKHQRTALWEKAAAFLEAKRDQKTGLVPADAVQQYDLMVAQIRSLGDEIQRLEEQAEIERMVYGDDADRSEDSEAAVSATGAEVSGAADAGNAASSLLATRSYRDAFTEMLRGRGELTEVKNALSVGVLEEGGYTVADEFEHRLIQGLNDHNVIRSLSTVRQSHSGLQKIPVLIDDPKAYWVRENEPIQESEMKFNRLNLGAWKMATMIKATQELLDDSAFDVEAYVADAIARSIGEAEEEAFLYGTGSYQPTGLLHDTDGAGIGADAKGKVTFDSIMQLYYSLKAPYRKNAVFLCNEDLLLHLMMLKDGNGNFIWKPGLEIGEPDTLLGRPIHTSIAMPEMQTGNKVLLFGDFSYYWIVDRGDRSLVRLNELYALQEVVGFKYTQRLDSRLILPEAMKVLRA